MTFWGAEVKPGKVTPFVPPPEASKLHLSQACLAVAAGGAKNGGAARAALRVKVGDGEPLLLAVLREGGTECLGLDLLFDQYAEFSVEGGAAVHLTGYYMPEYELGDEEEEEEDSDDDLDLSGLRMMPGGIGATLGGRQVLGIDGNGVPIMADEYDSGDDSDYESEDEDEEEEDDEEDVTFSRGGRRDVSIEEITEPSAGRAAMFEDDDVDGSDDEEEDDSEEGESGEEEEDSEEEEAPAPAPAAQKRKGAEPPAKQQQQQAKKAKPAAQTTPAPAPAAKKQQQQTPAAAKAEPAAKKAEAAAPAPASGGSKGGKRSYPNGFEIEDVKMGRPDGKLAKSGKKVIMKYVGKLKSNGKVFDQTAGSKTFSFRLGVGEVIKGWDRGIEGMRVGDKRKLTIPPQMAYGTSGVRGTIPPNATLTFDVELVDVK